MHDLHHVVLHCILLLKLQYPVIQFLYNTPILLLCHHISLVESFFLLFGNNF